MITLQKEFKMLEIVSTFYIAIVMVFITLVHIYWLGGGLWPGSNYQDLVDKVLGTGDKLPNKFAFIFVIVVFCLMAIFPIVIFTGMEIMAFEKEVLLFFSLLFFIRSLYMFIPFIADKTNRVFLELNKKIYAPLCFTLSLSYLYLSFLH